MDKTIIFSLFHENSKVELLSTIFYNKFFVKFCWHHVNGIFRKGNVSFNIYCNVRKSDFVNNFLNLQSIKYDEIMYYNKFLDVYSKFQDVCSYTKDVLMFDYQNYANFLGFMFKQEGLEPYLFVFVERYMNVNNILYCKTSGVEIYYNDTWKKIKELYFNPAKDNESKEKSSDQEYITELNLNELSGSELL